MNAMQRIFTREGIREALHQTRWAILSAENPYGRALPDSENAARSAELQGMLELSGIDFIPVHGHYGRPEKSFILLDVPIHVVLVVARWFGQESVLFPAGLLYLSSGHLVPATGVTIHETPPADFYSVLPDGICFTIELDFPQE
jgi:hypothetical protein